MKKLILFCFVILIFTSLVSGLCEEWQIDINSATLAELDEIDHVGPAVAGYIIDSRPFNSLSELINIRYISEGYLDDILDEGLACVNGYEGEEPKEETNEVVEEENLLDEGVEDPAGGLGGEAPLTPEVISLTPKDIKSEEDKKVLDKTDYAKYGFIAFCILIGVLLILKNKRKQKNEIV